MNSATVTTETTVNPSIQNPKQPQQKQTAKEAIAANVQALIEQLEQGHSEGLTAYLTAMGKFHNYSFGNILDIHGEAGRNRDPGPHARNQLGRNVRKGEHGIRIPLPLSASGARRMRKQEGDPHTESGRPRGLPFGRRLRCE